VLSALLAEGAPIMVQARQLGLNVPIIGGNGMNSVKVFDLAKDKAEGLWVGSPWSIENQSEANRKFVVAYTGKYKTAPDQFAAQAYDGLYIAAQAMKKIKLSGSLPADRAALRNALPEVKWSGATGDFQFRRATDKAGRPAGYDAQQTAIVSVTRGGKFSIEK
jgi:branched-chain amino acid transport system substrate-binding protein